MKKLLFVPLIILLLITIAIAAYAQEDFTAFGTGTINTFQCTQQNTIITVINSGSTSSTYFVEVDGSASKWASFAPITFTLLPGQSIQAKQYLDIPCDAKGTYNLNTYIVTADGTEKAIPQAITVRKPQNIDIRANVFSQKINPCETAKYSLTIVNPADFTEEYTFSVDSFKNETYFSEDKLEIPAKSERILLLDVEPASCSISGEYTIVFSAKAEKTGITAEMDIALEITDQGIAEFTSQANKVKTDYAEKGIELELSNKGKETAEYALSVSGADWITVQPEKITIEGKKSKTISLLFRPTNETEEGKYAVKIAAATGLASYTKEIIVQLGEPSLIEVLFKEYTIYTISALVIIIALILLTVYLISKLTSEEAKLARAKKRAEKQKRKEELQKEREKQKKLLLLEKEKQRKQQEFEKEKQKKLKELEQKRKERELEAANKKAIKKYEQELKSEYTLISKKEIAEGKRTPTRWLLNLILFVIIMLIIAMFAQFRAFFWNNKWYVLAGIIILALLYIFSWLGRGKKITARWKGLLLANEVLPMDIKWRKGLQQASFTLSSPARKIKTVIINGRARHSRYFKPKDFVYQYFRAECNIPDIKDTKFRFKVKKSWLDRREIDPSNVALAILKGDTYQKLKIARESSDSKYVYYSAKADDFGQFAIVGTTSAKERYRPYWIAWLVLAALIIIAAGIGAKLYSSENIQTKGIPMQAWNQDEQHTLDLKKYFADPDGDKLSFGVTETDNINIEIREGIAYFTPDYGWSGQAIVTFAAKDDHGAKAQSNPVKLVVKNTIIPKEYVWYLKYVLAGIIILIMLIAVLVLRKPVMKWIDEEENS